MEDRIQINGEWYVKESTTYDAHQKELDLTYFEGCVYETDKYCFEVTRLYKDYSKNEFYSSSIDIKFTDKRTQPWKMDRWDRVSWLIGVHHNDKDALNDVFELMDADGVRELKDFIRELINKGWITYE
jgi:hypothetical protein